jgi:hypothetical protein
VTLVTHFPIESAMRIRARYGVYRPSASQASQRHAVKGYEENRGLEFRRVGERHSFVGVNVSA